jgi:hypothetical protein
MPQSVETEKRVKFLKEKLKTIQKNLPRDPAQDLKISGINNERIRIERLKEEGRALGLEPPSLWQRISKFFFSSTPSYQGAPFQRYPGEESMRWAARPRPIPPPKIVTSYVYNSGNNTYGYAPTMKY